ncbi:uncharacterized protein PHALS_12038 [Plasmopara halstedii]|uniref:Uncharacterized protein n=1 Tax=Plasmopara halstedii TaxID=4781 RepID=A0A0N7L5K2_PLAHL|nr:uncharacterized protein PHALS_12038 [Plasmopara halstedii]CEG41707.1 hypothetical protein PHALS_12038 [Plasmopara halstedii]|eukprot:XP_024578076.1 hypothetical protein PHALS_12038 [Plasmopara halstedii]
MCFNVALIVNIRKYQNINIYEILGGELQIHILKLADISNICDALGLKYTKPYTVRGHRSEA